MHEFDDASYVPGPWVAIAASSGCLLVDLLPEDPVVRRCWKLLSEDAGADAVLDALVAGGIGSAPAFALVTLAGGGLRTITRHPAAIAVYDSDRETRLAAAVGVSWQDVSVTSRVDALTLHGPAAATSVELPMGTGVTTASTMQLRRGAATAEPAPVEAPVVEAPVVEAPVVEVPVVGVPVVTDDDGAADVPSYDHLFGASIRRPSVPSPEPSVGAAPTDTQPDADVPEPVPTTHTAGWSTAPPPAPDEGVIAGVPWAADAGRRASAEPRLVEEAPAAPDTRDDGSATVSRAQLQASSSAGPTVLAGRCPDGHLSPPYADRCRVCQKPMPPQEAFEIARPSLGVLRLPSGDVVTLDRGALLGRSPDLSSGPDRPHVLRVTSPDNDISRNHAEFVLDGWNVYVRDLDSTNGTVVQLRGREPVRVRENELTLIEDGTRVTLAEEATIVFEARS